MFYPLQTHNKFWNASPPPFTKEFVTAVVSEKIRRNKVSSRGERRQEMRVRKNTQLLKIRCGCVGHKLSAFSCGKAGSREQLSY